MTQTERDEMAREALARVEQGASVTNYPAIFAGFTAMGIPKSEIEPRVNVFTFHAWKAKGRSVMKGQHGVRVVTFIEKKDDATGEVVSRYPSTSVVFHISQTELTSNREARFAANGGERHGEYRRRNGYYKPYARLEPRPDVRDPGEDAADRWIEK